MLGCDLNRPGANAIDWRWQVAQKLLAAPRRRKLIPVDPHVSHLLSCFRSRDRKPGSRRHVGPDPDWTALHGAIQIRTNRGDLTDEIESFILAGETDATIGGRFGFPAAIIAEYERAFFHVRDRLDARDWIRARVIGTTLPPDQDGPILKLFAYSGGPIALELVLAVMRRRKLPKEIASTFAKDPKYEEARLRTLVELAIAAVRDASFSELAGFIDVYQLARQVDMNRIDVPPLFKGDFSKYGLFFRAAHAASQKRNAPSQRRQPSDVDYSKIVSQGVAAFRSMVGQSTQSSPKGR